MARARQESITADRIVSTATELIETEGLAGLTMRGLASKLSVPVTTIYWHVGNKDTLLDAVVDRIIDRFRTVPVRGRDHAARIAYVCRRWRRNLLEQPTLVGLVHTQGRTAQLFLPLGRALLRELSAAGLGGHDAAMAMRVTLRFVSGAVLTDLQVERAPSQRVTLEELWSEDDMVDRPDLLAELRQPGDPDTVFEYAITRLVTALITVDG